MVDQIESRAARGAWREHFVFTESRDGLPLEGAVIAPAGAPDELALVWIHGGASKFCERHYIFIGREVAARGYSFLAGNTRGHDGVALLWHGDQIALGGGSFERFDESPLDVAAWLDVAMTLGVRGVVLAGHSLGASKVVYYQAMHDDARIRGVVAASPMVGWQSNAERVALAEGMVADGRGEELLPHLEGSPRWNIASAQMVQTREQIIRHAFDSDTQAPHIARVRCPLLVLYGADETVGTEWLETLRRNARAASRIDIELIEGANHDYAGQEARVAAQISDWMGALV